MADGLRSIIVAGVLLALPMGLTGAVAQEAVTTPGAQSNVGDTGQGNNQKLLPANPSHQTDRTAIQNQSGGGPQAAEAPASPATGPDQQPTRVQPQAGDTGRIEVPRQTPSTTEAGQIPIAPAPQ